MNAPGADARRALLDKNEALLVDVTSRPKQHAANQLKMGGVAPMLAPM